MHYFLIAGEPSGDLHASHLIFAIRRLDPDARFSFLGGDLMAKAAQTKPIIHYNQMAYMGFSEVIRHASTIFRNLRTARRALADAAPDCLILIDYPSFNLKMARTARRLGIPAFYYISPKVWAWKEYRVRQIRRLISHMYVILPFEVDFYRSRHSWPVTYVGNPTVAEVADAIAAAPSRAQFLAEHSLRDRPIVALLPGSRRSEIRNNLPVMVNTIRQFPQYRGVIAAAPGIPLDFYRSFSDLPLVANSTFALLKHSRAALVTSGTATLETALAGVPQVALYRANGSKLSYNIMKHLLKVRFVTLPNLIADAPVIPELLLHFCTPELVTQHLAKLLTDSPERKAQLDGYSIISQRLGTTSAPDIAAADIIHRLKNSSH